MTLLKNKKLVATVAVLLAAVAFFLVYFYVIKPKTSEGLKTVTVQISADGRMQSVSWKADTRALTVKDLLIELNQSKNAQAVFSAAGFLDSLMGITPNVNEHFWAFFVDGNWGGAISEQPVVDGQVYAFVLTAITDF